MKNFKIPSIPPTTNKCIRFPNDIIKDVEKAIEGKNCTFTAFVVEAVRVALENIEDEDWTAETHARGSRCDIILITDVFLG